VAYLFFDFIHKLDYYHHYHTNLIVFKIFVDIFDMYKVHSFEFLEQLNNLYGIPNDKYIGFTRVYVF